MEPLWIQYQRETGKEHPEKSYLLNFDEEIQSVSKINEEENLKITDDQINNLYEYGTFDDLEKLYDYIEWLEEKLENQ